MSIERSRIPRRDFFRHSVGIGTSALAIGHVPVGMTQMQHDDSTGVPLIITSHSNDTGKEAMRQAWDILNSGGNALDAVERGANVIEVDPEDSGVGYGGMPNEEGVVQLDASVMDGKTYNAGSVASLENIKTPASVARLVMERTDHVMLICLLYTSPSPRDQRGSRMPSSA